LYDQLKSRVADILRRPQPLKPQTERQLAHHLAEHSSNIKDFLLCAAKVLEDHELDILFAPVFTPTLDHRAEVTDLLFHWRPSEEQIRQLISDLSKEVSHAIVMLPDGTTTELTLHEVMIDRFVRLLRLDAAPDPATAAALRDSLKAELWPIAMALLCERGMTPRHQKWFAAFVNHTSSRRAMTREFLQATADFLAAQKNLDRADMVLSAEALMRATQSTTAFAAAGHNYWSGDVAQHHHYRGQGTIDKERVAKQQAELEHVTALVEDLKTFEA